jgi:Domain of unknown function (DUF4157)
MAQSEAPPFVDDVLREREKPLDRDTRSFFEPRFGADFSKVRVHADAQAAESANGVDGRAFTVGNDMVFNQGEFAPGIAEGSRLIAYELAHVVPQRSHRQASRSYRGITGGRANARGVNIGAG